MNLFTVALSGTATAILLYFCKNCSNIGQRTFFANIQLVLEHREKNNLVICPGKNKLYSVFSDFSEIQKEELAEKIGQFCKVVIRFHPGHPHLNIINTSFCALIRLLLTKLNHYSTIPSIQIRSFCHSK